MHRYPKGSVFRDKINIVATDGNEIFNSDKRISLLDFGWRDITSEVVVRGIGATNPTWSQISGTPFYDYQFAVNDECWMNFHIPHDYVKGTVIYFHAHWIPDGTNINPVKWQWIYSYAHGHNQMPFDLTGITIAAEQVVGGAQYQHYVTETLEVMIPDMEPDGVIKTNIRRVTNGAADNTDGIFLQTSDIHYFSNNASTPNRAPDFYA